MLHLYPARLQEDATHALYNAMQKALAHRSRAFLVVPNQFTVEAEQALFESLHTEVLFQVQVKSFAALVRDIQQAGRGSSRTVLTEQGMTMLVRRLLQRQDADWTVFTPGTRGKGLISRLTRALREYRAYGISPERLLALSTAFDPTDRSHAKFEELSRLYAAYEEALSDALCDADQRMRDAFAQLATLNLFDDVTFFFDRFHSLSLVERDALAALLEKGCDVHVALLLDPRIARVLARASTDVPFELLESQWMAQVEDAQAFTLTARFARELMELGRFRVHETPRTAPLPAIQRASDAVFSFRPLRKGAPRGDDALRLRQFRTTEQEVDALVMEIRRLVQEEGMRYRDILVVLSDTSEYAPLVRRTFTAEGLPFFYDERREVTYHPLIQALHALMDIAVRGPRSFSMLALAKTGLVGLDEEAVEIYQQFVRRRRIEYDMFYVPRYFTLDENVRVSGEDERERMRREYAVAQQVNDALLAVVRPFVKDIHEAKSVQEQCEALVRVLRAPSLLRGLVAYANALEEAQAAERLAVHEQIWQSVMGVCSEAVLLFGNETLSLTEFRDVLSEGLNGISPGVIPPYADQIVVGDLKRTRVRPRRAVFFLGLNDLHLPAAQKDNDLLREEEKALISETQEPLPSMHAFAVEEERLDVYATLHLPTDRLYLSTAMQTTANDALSPSYWLVRISEVSGSLPVQADFPLADAVYSHKLLCEALPHLLTDVGVSPAQQQVATGLLEEMQRQEAWREDAQAISRAMARELRTQPLPNFMVPSLYPSETISPSEIEVMARCPYRSFVQNGLRPERQHDMPIQRDESGRFIHATLDAWTAFVSERLERAGQVDAEDSQAAMDASFDRQVGQEVDGVRRERPENQYLLQQMKESLAVNHERLYTQLMDSAIEHVEHEMAFGRQASTGILLRNPHRDIMLKGRIDRLDHVREDGADWIQVIDYKTGKASFDISKVLTGQSLQLPLYAAVAQQRGEVVASVYYPVHPPQMVDDGRAPSLTLKEEKMDGFVLSDPIMTRFDPTIDEESRYALNQKDWKKSPNVLSRPLLNRLIEEATLRAEQLTASREAGALEVHPLYVRHAPNKKDTFVGCQYCPYHALCHFEVARHFGRHHFVEACSATQWKAQVESEES